MSHPGNVNDTVPEDSATKSFVYPVRTLLSGIQRSGIVRDTSAEGAEVSSHDMPGPGQMTGPVDLLDTEAVAGM
jgi:hypothetical protein